MKNINSTTTRAPEIYKILPQQFSWWYRSHSMSTNFYFFIYKNLSPKNVYYLRAKFKKGGVVDGVAAGTISFRSELLLNFFWGGGGK